MSRVVEALFPHTRASWVLDRNIGTPHDDDTTGPDGRWILDRLELHLGDDILVPDLAGCLLEQMPELSGAAYMTVAPDWGCEALSVSSRRVDLQEKRPVYAREGVTHLGLIDSVDRTLEAFELPDGEWVLIACAPPDSTP